MKETTNNNFGTEEKVLVTAIDHGFGNMKTVNTCFKTGVVAYDSEPTFKNNLLIYQGRYFKIGESHKEFIADKIQDEDYYILMQKPPCALESRSTQARRFRRKSMLIV